MMKKNIQRVCARICGILMIPALVATPITAAENQGIQTSAVESADITTPAPESGPIATPVVSPQPTTTPAPVAFKSAIPDEKFRKIVNDVIFAGALKDTDLVTPDLVATMNDYTGTLELRNKELVNLKGIEYFTSMTELDCSHNKLQLLDLTALKNLKQLNVSYNDLTQLTIGNDSTLETIDCSNNKLELLNLAAITTVQNLDCSDNELTMLNVAGLYQLKVLECSDNKLSGLAVDGLVGLQELYCEGNALLNLNVTTLRDLKILECRKSEITLKAQAVGTSESGVVLPKGAVAPMNISEGGTYQSADNAIIWDKMKGVPASFTYTYTIPGRVQEVLVRVNVDKTGFVEKAIELKQVSSLKVTSTGYNKVKLTWNGVDGATGYRIYRATSKNGKYTKIKSITSNSKVSYTNSGIACGTTYYYKVRAYRLIDGNYYFGAYSGIVSGKPIPAAPGGVSVAKSSKNKVKISWNKVSGASGYRVYRSTSKSSGFSKIKTVKSGSTLSYKKATTRYKKYYYKVRAYKTVNGKKIWGTYSKVKAKTLK